MCGVISSGHFSGQKLMWEHASNWTQLLEENRNHVWSDLSRLVDVECKNDCSLLKAFFRPEVVNRPQTGLCCWRRTGTMCGVISPGHFSGQKL